jgi:hypothetical protein
MCLKLWFECCDFWLDFSVVWMVSVLDYGWMVSSWYRFNFLGTMFSCFFLVSATSSYADDIAYIKILYEQKPMWFPQPQGRGVRFSFLSYGGTDSLLLLTGIF